MEGCSGIRIDRKPSIEREPMTLRLHQIQYAREAAVYVMSTRSIEEALSIFTEGLEPVALENVIRQNDRTDPGEEEVHYLGEDQLQVPVLKDVATAPF